jgi:hypothetical protein
MQPHGTAWGCGWCVHVIKGKWFQRQDTWRAGAANATLVSGGHSDSLFPSISYARAVAPRCFRAARVGDARLVRTRPHTEPQLCPRSVEPPSHLGTTTKENRIEQAIHRAHRRLARRSCNDKDISCASWSREGLCDTDTVVKDLCPHSCGVCSVVCSDRDESCAAWAKDGECTKSPDYMLKECPTSCGLCAPKCADLHIDCNHWGKDGSCESNAGFMNLHCPVTCGVCKASCKDTHDDCPGWAKEGECVNNPGHTLKACPFSCGVTTCKTGCADKNATSCAVWALEDECMKNPAMMLQECPDTCGVCSKVCEDKSKDCGTWATEGHCESNPDGMLSTCPQACGLCHELEKFYRSAIGDKDEL